METEDNTGLFAKSWEEINIFFDTIIKGNEIEFKNFTFLTIKCICGKLFEIKKREDLEHKNYICDCGESLIHFDDLTTVLK